MRAAVETVEEPLAAAEQDRHDYKVHFVDQAGAEVLLNGGRAAAEPHVPAVRGSVCLLQRGLDAIGYEMERRAALHRDRGARIVGEHEDRVMVRRVVSPPALPLVVAPRSADWTEHVAPYDRGADAGVAPCGELVVEPRGAAARAEHPLEGASGERPLVQPRATHAQRVVEILPGAGSVAVQRDREVVYAQLWHRWFLSSRRWRQPAQGAVPRRNGAPPPRFELAHAPS